MEGKGARGGGGGLHIHDHLLAAEEGVADEFTGAERYRLLLVGHICELIMESVCELYK